MTAAAITGKQLAAMIAGFGGVMAVLLAIHSEIVVPQILSKAENRAHELAAAEANLVRDELRQRVAVAEQMHATYVTHAELEQLTRQIDLIQAQLQRIEERLSR